MIFVFKTGKLKDLKKFCELCTKFLSMKNFKRILFSIVCVLVSVTCFFSCQKSEKRIVMDGLVQGTYYHIVFYSQDTTGIKQDIKTIFASIDSSLSLWVENSTINRVNRNEDVFLDDIFIANFNSAMKFSSLTDGAFDITVGELVRKHGFANKNREKLTDAQVDSLLQFVGYANLSINNGKLIKKLPQTTLDFNAIAQGYTSDTIASYFRSRNIHSFIVDVGGEVMCGDKKPDNSKWAVGIEQPAVAGNNNNGSKEGINETNPYSERKTQQIIYLENESVVTSGNYRKFYIEDGVKYSHTINPKTGHPVTHSLLSASVIAKDATTADALATAFMVMGLDETRKFLESHKEYATYLIYCDKNGQMHTWQSSNFNKYTQK